MSFLSFFILTIISLSPEKIDKGVLSTTSPEIFYNASSLTQNESNARQAAVKIEATDEEGTNFGSGSYMIMNNRHVVITARHVMGAAVTAKVHGQNEEVVTGRMIYKDDVADIAFILIPPMQTRSPILLRLSDESKTDLIGRNVNYTGFPSGHNLLTIRGTISGIEQNRGFLLLHAYAWMGASGSCIFDDHGNLIGVLSAVEVGDAILPQIIEDIVWISPAKDFNFSEINDAINSLSEDQLQNNRRRNRNNEINYPTF